MMGVFDVISYLALGLGIVAVVATVISVLLSVILDGRRPAHRIRVEIDGREIIDARLESLSPVGIQAIVKRAVERYEARVPPRRRAIS
jgi:hypothetical protein